MASHRVLWDRTYLLFILEDEAERRRDGSCLADSSEKTKQIENKAESNKTFRSLMISSIYELLYLSLSSLWWSSDSLISISIWIQAQRRSSRSKIDDLCNQIETKREHRSSSKPPNQVLILTWNMTGDIRR
ncbi:unnamed protein product [Arabidopsis lyrata]|nr:unnamed protein product [Arabidopsis lyrata]